VLVDDLRTDAKQLHRYNPPYHRPIRVEEPVETHRAERNEVWEKIGFGVKLATTVSSSRRKPGVERISSLSHF